MKSLVLRAGLLIAAAVSIPIACKRGGGDEILVGEYGSLTGTTATFGQSTNNAIQMAFDEINSAGGLLGKKVRVAVEDDQSKPEEAATAVTKLINQNHVVAMLGEDVNSEEFGFVSKGRVRLAVNHTVMGNPVRMHLGTLQLHLDDEWRSAMSSRQRTIVSFLTRPLLRRYGYRP